MKQILTVAALLATLLMPVAAQKKITDNTITDQVRLRLSSDSEVKGGSLDVDVKDGVVTVKGRVHSDRAHQKIDRLVKKVKGVNKVVNQVAVER